MTANLRHLRASVALGTLIGMGVHATAQQINVNGGDGQPQTYYRANGVADGIGNGPDGGEIVLQSDDLSALLLLRRARMDLFVGAVGISMDGGTGQNTLLGLTNSSGIVNTGAFNTTTFASTGNGQVGGALGVTGLASTNGIVNTGNITTDTLTVNGAAIFNGPVSTNGLTNNGNISTTTLATTGNATVGGNLAVQGVTSTNGIDNNGQVISNVAPGVAPTDAVNVQQMNAMSGSQAAAFAQQDRINATQAQINSQQTLTNAHVQQQLTSNRKVASTGAAVAVAAASIPALEAGKEVGVGAGVGHYDGQSAFAIGVAARLSESLQIKLNVGTGPGGRAAVGAGGMWSW